MILRAKDNDVPSGWIGMDSFYGEQPWLRNEIASKGMIYIYRRYTGHFVSRLLGLRLVKILTEDQLDGNL